MLDSYPDCCPLPRHLPHPLALLEKRKQHTLLCSVLQIISQVASFPNEQRSEIFGNWVWWEAGNLSSYPDMTASISVAHCWQCPPLTRNNSYPQRAAPVSFTTLPAALAKSAGPCKPKLPATPFQQPRALSPPVTGRVLSLAWLKSRKLLCTSLKHSRSTTNSHAHPTTAISLLPENPAQAEVPAESLMGCHSCIQAGLYMSWTQIQHTPVPDIWIFTSAQSNSDQ